MARSERRRGTSYAPHRAFLQVRESKSSTLSWDSGQIIWQMCATYLGDRQDKSPRYSDDELASHNRSLTDLYNARARYVERASPRQPAPVTLPSAPVVQASQGSWSDWQSRQPAPQRSQRTALWFLAAFVLIVVALITLPSTFVSVLCFSVAALAITIGTITLLSRC